MLLTPSLGVIVLFCCMLFSAASIQAAGHDDSVLIKHYKVRETAYRMEQGFRDAVEESIVPGLPEPEQMAKTCLSVRAWARRNDVEVDVFFSDSYVFKISKDIIPFLTPDGLKKLAGVLPECAGPCVALVSVDNEGCILVQNSGLVMGSSMQRSGFMLQKEGVRVVVPEGTRFCKRPGLA